ncbi:MAG: hypothetical protein H6Q74_79 [Firmicutes bacterium]|nr:hypothetical protein [Bacillota bacterium]
MALVQIHLGTTISRENKSKIAQEVSEIISKYSECDKATIQVIVWQNAPDAPEDSSVFMVCDGQEKQYIKNSVCIY